MVDDLKRYKGIVPKQVIIEVLKEQLKIIFKEELEVIKKLTQKCVKYTGLSISEKGQLCTSYYYVDKLRSQYESFKNIISNFNLSDDEIKELYKFGKTKRQELGLSDNLFNVFEVFISQDEEMYERANQKIKKINNF